MNPFAQVYDALWTLLESRTALTDMVRVKNRIKFSSAVDRDPMKDQVQAADMPELMLISFGGTPNTHATNTSASILRNYQLLLSTGDFRLDQGLYDIEFEVFAALSDWNAALRDLTYKGNRFVTLAQLSDLSEGLTDGQANRGIRGWSSIWTGQVQMYFNKSDLLQ